MQNVNNDIDRSNIQFRMFGYMQNSTRQTNWSMWIDFFEHLSNIYYNFSILFCEFVSFECIIQAELGNSTINWNSSNRDSTLGSNVAVVHIVYIYNAQHTERNSYSWYLNGCWRHGKIKFSRNLFFVASVRIQQSICKHSETIEMHWMSPALACG